jgi:hypothetical protein
MHCHVSRDWISFFVRGFLFLAGWRYPSWSGGDFRFCLMSNSSPRPLILPLVLLFCSTKSAQCTQEKKKIKEEE